MSFTITLYSRNLLLSELLGCSFTTECHIGTPRNFVTCFNLQIQSATLDIATDRPTPNKEIQGITGQAIS